MGLFEMIYQGFVLSASLAVSVVGLGWDDKAIEEMALSALKAIKTGVEEYEPNRVRLALDDIDSIYDKVTPKIRGKIHKGLGSMFSNFVPKEAGMAQFEDNEEESWGEKQRALEGCYVLAVGILFDKEEGDEILLTALKRSHIKDWPRVRAVIYEGLSYRDDPDLIKHFTQGLSDPAYLVVAASVNALGRFQDHDMKVRRVIVKNLVEAYAGQQAVIDKAVRRKKGVEEAEQFMLHIEVPFNDALMALTRQACSDATEWEEWFDENGSEDVW